MKKLYSIIALVLVGIGVSAQCSITSGPTITVNGLTINATAQGAGATSPAYVWDWGDASTPGTMQNDQHTYAGPGTYTVCVVYADQTNPFTCFDSSCTVVTVNAVGINDPNASALNVQAIPNPFNSQLTINLTMSNTEMVEVALYDMTGKQVAILKNGVMSAGANVIEWKPAGLTAGVYFLQVKTNHSLITKKVIYTQN